ncbi:MAG: DUF1549 domain-containing protein [Verrucomicrobiales bacterium]|nr:DUF1549 domain-containing protein [Verrucomicrobiales bacterium]
MIFPTPQPRATSTVGAIGAALYLTALMLPADATEGFGFFKEKVEPILVKRCYDCHSEEAGKQKGGLWLDRKAAWQQGGDAGSPIVPGDLESSLLVHTIRYLDEDLQMPPKAKLPKEEIAILEQWVKMGAPDPRDAALAGAVRKAEIDYETERQKWAFRPHQNPVVPNVKNAEWPRSEVDRFILANLELQNLEPTADANPRALLRRVYFDLIGLPPTPEETAAFAGNPTPEAFAKIVDDLLARPAFGEKWGRHWLDVARYSDSNGGDRNFTFHQAWRYRNYVIDSFNRDRSFYQFVRQQIAGDLIEAKSDTERADNLIASGFLALGPKMLTERDKEKLRLDTADEQVDTVGRAFLGLTMGCARCHDHKFDPISQEDYYAMAGIFRSTQIVMGTQNGCVNVASWVETPLPGPNFDKTKAKVDRMELAMKLVIDAQFKQKAGGKMTPNMLPLGGVIYDDADAERVGEWKPSSFSENRFGDGYIHDDKSKKGEKKIVFRASLPTNGVYEVRLSYNGDERYANNIPITVEGWGKTHHVTLDQSKTASVAGLFEPIGQFKFEKGGRANVIIETKGTDPGKYVIVDAIQFIKVSDIGQEAEALAAVEDEAGGNGMMELLRMSEGDLKKELSKLLGELRKGEVAMAARDADDAGDIHLRVRGEVSQRGKLVARNFPRIIHTDDVPKISENQSGRLELATWMAAPENALLDRVMVNRIWHHLFGRGIVASVDNFGSLGAQPTHPDLLDFLASDFRNSGGSVKQMVRKLVLSRAYQLSADSTEALAAADPKNQLFGHQNRRRLTAEEIRDSVLALSGSLSKEKGGATSLKYGVDLDKPMNYAKEQLRTVYLPIARNNAVPELAVFDVANPDLVSGSRAETTVPTQALYLMNSEFYKTKAASIGKAVWEHNANDAPDAELIRLYRTILNRPPTAEELARASEFVGSLSSGAELTDLGNRQPMEEAYGHLAHLLIVSAEFLFLE